METLRDIVIVIHLIGFAILFGSWVVEAVARRYQATRLMDLGVLVAGVAGLALAAPWGLDGGELNYVKIGIKLVVLIVIGGLIGVSTARAKKGRPLPSWVFWLIGGLTLFNVALAIIW
jgi:hypothetical protein